jgi:hypothetical protein
MAFFLSVSPSYALQLLQYRYNAGSTGRLAQLVERLPYTQNVGGSSPSAPTRFLCNTTMQEANPGSPFLHVLS